MAINTPRILCVDDQSDDLEILTHILKRAGFITETATNGYEALEALFSEREFDLVLLDRMMPGIDGLDVCRKIKEKERFRELPIIFQTALSSDEEVRQGYEAGAFYYLPKPFKSEDLLHLTNHALEKRKMHLEIEKTRSFIADLKEMLRFGLERVTNLGFRFRSLNRARCVAHTLSLCFKKPRKAVPYIYELLQNAIEHGNAGITLEEKTELLKLGIFEEELDARLQRKELKEKFVSVQVEKLDDKTILKISDGGEGFDWQRFMNNPTTGQALRPNGKGLFMVRNAFSEFYYEDSGRTAVVVEG